MMRKVWIIAGIRHFSDNGYMEAQLERHALLNGYPDEVVSGTAKGADSCGEAWARIHGIPVRRFPADWNTHGRSAGPIRNNQMAEYARNDGVLFLFWDGKSAGSRSMLAAAQKRGIPVIQFIVPELCK